MNHKEKYTLNSSHPAFLKFKGKLQENVGKVNSEQGLDKWFNPICEVISTVTFETRSVRKTNLWFHRGMRPATMQYKLVTEHTDSSGNTPLNMMQSSTRDCQQELDKS